jgi:nuclear transport factor 2 (NTF2) superfamily protein
LEESRRIRSRAAGDRCIPDAQVDQGARLPADQELWAFTDNRIAVRFAYEWHDDAGTWFRSYGNENWEFDNDELMRRRLACINDLPIKEADRKFFWPLGARPAEHPGLCDLEL